MTIRKMRGMTFSSNNIRTAYSLKKVVLPKSVKVQYAALSASKLDWSEDFLTVIAK